MGGAAASSWWWWWGRYGGSLINLGSDGDRFGSDGRPGYQQQWRMVAKCRWYWRGTGGGTEVCRGNHWSASQMRWWTWQSSPAAGNGGGEAGAAGEECGGSGSAQLVVVGIAQIKGEALTAAAAPASRGVGGLGLQLLLLVVKQVPRVPKGEEWGWEGQCTAGGAVH